VKAAGFSVADELAKLAQLRDSGVLSEEEFLALKSKLIEDHTGSTIRDQMGSG